MSVSRANVVLALLLCLLIGGSLSAAYLLWHKHLWAVGVEDEITPRYARLLGLQNAGTEIDALLARAQDDLQKFSYPADMAADRVGTELQQRVRKAAEGAGLTISSSQLMPSRPHNGFEELVLSLTVDGRLDALQSFLLSVQGASPRALVGDLDIRPRLVRRGKETEADQSVTVRMTVSHFRLLP